MDYYEWSNGQAGEHLRRTSSSHRNRRLGSTLVPNVQNTKLRRLWLRHGTGGTPAPVPGRLETVLVVDDDEANRNVLGRRLAKLGYGVVEARDGVEALECLAQPDSGIDLVLLDVMMPRLDGFAVLERHRADPAIRHISPRSPSGPSPRT